MPARKRQASNVDALARTVAALTLRPEHEALAVAARTLAEAVDKTPGDAQLWREYRAVLGDLVEVGTDVDNSDEAAFGAAVRTPLRPPLRDASLA